MTRRKSSSSFLRTRPFLLHGSPSAVWMTRALPNSSSSGVVCLPTYLLTYPLAHLHTSTSTSLSYLPTYSLAYLLTYPLAHLLTYVLAQCGCLHLSYQESTIPQALCQADSPWDAGVQLQANWQVHRLCGQNILWCDQYYHLGGVHWSSQKLQADQAVQEVQTT